MKLLELITYLIITIIGGFLGGTIAYLLWFNRPKMPYFDMKDVDKKLEQISKRSDF